MEPTKEQVEKVAEAMCREANKHDIQRSQWVWQQPEVRAVYIKCANAMIQAWERIRHD